MTNKERLISLVGFSAPVNSVEGALIDADVSADANYEIANKNKLLLSAKGLLQILLSTPDTTNENGYAIRYDRGAIQKRIEWIDGELVLIARSTIKALHLW